MKFFTRALACLLFCCTIVINGFADGIICPSDINEETELIPYVCGLDISVANPTPEDGCVLDSIINDFTNTDDASGFYPVGDTDVKFIAYVGGVKVDSCIISVSVMDVTSPIIACPSDTVAQCDLSEIPTPMTFEEFMGTPYFGDAVDNCELDTLTFELMEENIIAEEGCSTIVERVFYIEDIYGNTAECNQEITIEDTIDPEITCPDNQEIDVDNSCTAQLNLPPDFSDNCDNTELSFDINSGDMTGMGVVMGIFDPGIYDITYEVTDACGNSADCTFTVEVADNLPPSFTEPVPDFSGLTIACEDVPDGLPPHDPLMGGDNCTLVPMQVLDTLDFTPTCSGYTITYSWTLIDEAGNETTVTSDISISADNTAPVFDTAPTDLSAMSIACDDDLLETETLTASDDCNDAVVSVDTTYSSEDVCMDRTVTYTWTAMDSCMNETSVSTFFTIMAENRIPVIASPLTDMTFDADPMSCEANPVIPQPNVEGFCADITDISYTPTGPFGIGDHVIMWTATNECGLVSAAEPQTITIVDGEGPMLSCNPDLCVVLSSDEATIDYDDIINMPLEDLCGSVVSHTIERMTPGCSTPPDDMTVVLCCEDVANFATGDTLMVMATVTDDSGNESSCMVPVETKMIEPYNVRCPDGITVSCEFPIDTSDMFDFGTLHADPADATIITIMDDGLDPDPSFLDGVFTSPCPDGAIISESINDIRNDCNTGSIERTVTVTDVLGQSASCLQVIHIIDTDPFDETDITWPVDMTINYDNCVAETNPSTSPGPQIAGDNCSMVAISTETDTFDTPNSGCLIIRKRFTVMDWCQYVSMADPEVGIWRDTQYFTLVNTIPPSFIGGCPDELEVCVDPETCQANMSVSLPATDDCTNAADLEYNYGLDTDGDGVADLTGNTSSFLATLDFGEYDLVWNVDDKCGNDSTCTTVLSVIDCKAPTAACKFGIAANLNVMVIDGDSIPMVMAEVDLFNASSTDECSDYQFSFSGTDLDSTVATFGCAHIGENTIELWVTDDFGNQSVCITYLDVQDNYNLCPPLPTTGSISGRLITEDAVELSNVNVYLGSNEDEQMIPSDNEGTYAFSSLEMYKDYMLTAEHDIEHKNGISTLDIIIIQRHILGIEDLSSPYKLMAADVNKSQTITAIDLTEIRKIILGIYDDFPDNDSWIFVNAEQSFSDPMQPWNFDEYLAFPDFDQDAQEMDMIGVKIGDVNNSVAFTGDSDTRTAGMTLEYKKTMDGIDLIASKLTMGYGMQFSVPVASIEDFAIQSSVFENTSLFYEITDGIAHISIASDKLITVDKGGTMLRLQGVREAKLVTNTLAPEWYNASLETERLAIRNGLEIANSLEIAMAYPNPFMDKSQLIVDVPEAGSHTIKIYNNLAQVVYSNTLYLEKGKQNVPLTGSMVEGHYGVLLLQIESKNQRSGITLTRVR